MMSRPFTNTARKIKMGLLICYVLVSTFAFISGEHGNIVPNVGSSEKTTDAPWIVSLQLEKNNRAFCGATMIKSIQVGVESAVHSQNNSREIISEAQSERTTYIAHCSGWILTAASCTQKIPSMIIATLGNYDLEKEDEKEMQWLVNKEDIYIYPEYNATTNENDIALIIVKFSFTTEDDWEKAKTLRQSEIPVLRHSSRYETDESYSRFFTYADYYVYGWGLKTENGLLQKELHRTLAPKLSDVECGSYYGPEMYKPLKMMCAGGGGQGACSYDTGGPLVCVVLDGSFHPIPNETFVCGIVSFGMGCGSNSNPAVFTNTGYYVYWNWIWSTTNNN